MSSHQQKILLVIENRKLISKEKPAVLLLSAQLKTKRYTGHKLTM